MGVALRSRGVTPSLTIMSYLSDYYEMSDGTTLYEECIREIDHSTIQRLYNEGNYSCKLATPVNHTGWTDVGWINWINRTGRWWLDDCYWKYLGDGKYKSCRSSGFIERWNKAVDDELTKGYQECKKSSPEASLDRLKQIIELNKNLDETEKN